MLKKLNDAMPRPSADFAKRISQAAWETSQEFTTTVPFWKKWQAWLAGGGFAAMLSVGGVGITPVLVTAQAEVDDDRVELAYMVMDEEDQNTIELALAFAE